jgi:hypothetical protein
MFIRRKTEKRHIFLGVFDVLVRAAFLADLPYGG